MKFVQKVLKAGLLLAGIGLLPACESVVEVPIPEHVPKLAIRYMLGNVTPDSLNYAHFPQYQPYVNHSQSLFSTEELKGINNATLVLTDASGQVVETFKQDITSNVGIQGNGYYQPVTGFVATPGQKYTYQVSAPGYETVSSTLTMPSQVQGLQGSFTKLGESQVGAKAIEVTGQLTINLPDNGSENNYYLLYGVLLDNRLKANPRDFFQEASEDNEFGLGANFQDIHFSSIGYLSARPFDDKSFNGTPATINRNVNLFIGNADTPPRFLRVYLHSITFDTFRFLKSLDLYYENNGNPFAEATRVIGNVENGYGYFGGYTSTYVDITLP